MGSKARKVNLVEAQRMLDDGKQVREIAERYGVTTQSVYRLIQRETLRRRPEDQASPES